MTSVVRRAGQILRDHRLPGVRARFALFVLVQVVATVPAVLLSPTPAQYKPVALGAVAWLVLVRVREFRRARLGFWPLDLADAGAIAVLAVVPEGSVIGLLFAITMFRALFGSTPRVWMSMVMCSVFFVGVAVVGPYADPMPPDDAVVYALSAPILGYLLSTLRESITAHEEALRVEHAAVIDNEQFLAAVLDNLSDGVVACDPDGTLTVVNRAAFRFQGADAPRGSLGIADAPLRRALAGERVTDAELSVTSVAGTTESCSPTGSRSAPSAPGGRAGRAPWSR